MILYNFNYILEIETGVLVEFCLIFLGENRFDFELSSVEKVLIGDLIR